MHVLMCICTPLTQVHVQPHTHMYAYMHPHIIQYEVSVLVMHLETG